MQTDDLCKKPVSELVLLLSLPTVAGTVGTALLAMLDTAFLTKLSTDATAAAAIVFSLQALLQAFGFCFGLGAGCIAARKQGDGDQRAVESCVASAFWAALVFGFLFALVGTLFLKQLLQLLGATTALLTEAEAFAGFLLPLAPFLCASFVLSNALRSAGKSKEAMYGILIGGLFQLASEPFFLFILHWGIRGAAVANGLGQLIAFLIQTFFYLRLRPHGLHFQLFRIQLLPGIFKEGLPTLFRQGLICFSNIVLNKQALQFGVSATAAMSVANRLAGIPYAVILGIGQGFMPVAGQNAGASKMERVSSALRFSILLSTGITVALSLVLFVFAPVFIRRLRRDALQVLQLSVFSVRAQCIGLLTVPFAVCVNMLYQSLGNSLSAVILSCCRNGLFLLPLLLLLPKYFHIYGIACAQAIADGITFVFSIPFFCIKRKEFNANSP